MKIVHISDLHFGRKYFYKPLKELCHSLNDNQIDHIVITGDLTDRGLISEYNDFSTYFKEYIDNKKITIVPGNHDRLGQNISQFIMTERVVIEEYDNIYIIKIDSTGPHNKWLIYAHGLISNQVLAATTEALDAAPANKLVIVMLHHHPIPLPEETFLEKVSKFLNWPFAAELHLGKELISIAQNKADLLLYGHKHIPFEMILPGTKPLGLYNAGSTPDLKRYRIFNYQANQLDVNWVKF